MFYKLILIRYVCIFTNGSKSLDNTGCAFFDDTHKIHKKYKLPNFFSIYSAESIALIEALHYCKNLVQNKIFLITDNRNVLEKIQNINPKSKSNHLINNIINTTLELRDNNKIIKLIWTKAHCRIMDYQ